MVEYLPVGPKEAPQTIFGKKYFRPEIPNPLSQPSVLCTLAALDKIICSTQKLFSNMTIVIETFAFQHLPNFSPNFGIMFTSKFKYPT